MRKFERRWTVTIILILLSAVCHGADRSPLSAAKERPAAVAGSFYPGDRAQLSAFVDRAVANTLVPATGNPVVAIIAPHAGYPFSGAVAAHSYALLRASKFTRVVIIGPSHYQAFGYSSVYEGDAYSTPLGKVAVDREFARKLAKAGGSIRLASAGHSVGEPSEHSIEVELPFLQRTLGDFRVVPIVMGDQSYPASRALGLALAKLLKGDHSTLLVASSDLSHYHGYDQASRMDHNLLHAIQQDDFLSVSVNTERRVWEACGAGPIVTVMMASERLGASNPQLLKYANSGDVTRDRNRVVGYGAVAFLRGGERASAQPFALGEAERQELLTIARLSVESAVRNRKPYEPPAPSSSSLLQERGVFVTLTKHGQLRGCIGYTSPLLPLYVSVRDVAAYAALRDPRFPPVRSSELSDLEYEVSVLSPFRHVLDPKTVQVGQHGLLIRRGGEEGILLPQVPVEQGWDRNTFLEQVARKAGLEEEAWRDESADLFTFTALVFSDHEKPAAQR